MAAPPDDAARALDRAAPAWLRAMRSEEITVAVHTDARATMPPPAAPARADGADGAEPNMVYVAGGGEGNDDDSQAVLSVSWDAIHGERVEPRPILTYHPELLVGDAPLRGEVARARFKHVQLPSTRAYERVEAGLRLAHHRPDARLFCAGAWAHHFSMSHPGALKSGMTAALFARGRARPGLLLPEPLVQGPTARKKARLREARRLARRTARRARGLDAQHAREPPTPS